MRKFMFHARDGTRKRKRTLLGLIGVLVAVLVGLLSQQTVEAYTANDTNHSTAVYGWGGVTIKTGWYYDRSINGSEWGNTNIHTERCDYWNGIPTGIATGGIMTNNVQGTNHVNTGLSVESWYFGDYWSCIVRGDTVGLTPVFVAYYDENQKTGYTTSFSSSGNWAYSGGYGRIISVGGRAAYVVDVGNYCSRVDMARAFTPNTNLVYFHDAGGNVFTYHIATYDNGGTQGLGEYTSATGYTQVGWAPNNMLIYNSMTDAYNAYTAGKSQDDINAGYRNWYTFSDTWNNNLINLCCYLGGTTSNARVDLYPVFVRNSYTVYFNGNGGTTSVSSRPTLFGTGNWNVGAVSASRYNSNLGGYNYSLTGWSDASGNRVYDANGNAVSGVYWNNNGSSGCWQYAGNTTAYAQWSANTCKITFNGNGATSGSTGTPKTLLTGTQKIFQNVWTKLNNNGYARKGYDFAGWNTAADGSGTSYADGGNIYTGSNITLYAQWKSSTFKLKSDVNSPENATATGGWGEVNSYCGNTSYQTIATASCDGYSFLGWFTKKDGGEMVYDANGNVVKNTSFTDANGGHIFDDKSGDTVTLYAHWATFDISSVSVTLGYQEAPLSNGNMTTTATYARQNVYTDTGNSPYGSNVYVNAVTRTVNGGTSPNITKVWVTVQNSVDPSQTKDYVLYSDTKGTATYDGTSLVNTVADFPGAMDLTYVLHVQNAYGLTKTSTTYTSRDIELFTTVEKVNTDINGTSDNSFSAGTRGVLHVYTTGWVDDFNFVFPNTMYKSWEYDRSLDYPVMDPSANDVFGFTENDPNMATYPLSGFPSSIKLITGAEGYQTFGSTEFIRCYDFYFWIPLSISNPDNPDAQIVDEDTTWVITTIARKFYTDKPVYEDGVLTGKMTHSVSTTTTTQTVLGGDPVKVTDQFRTVIKSVK